MTRTSKTRSALFTSIISLLLCVSMLVGTTFAWFTDEVVSGRNVIAAGNLDVELYHSDKNESNVQVKGDTKLFNDVVLWEPGAVLYDTLQVKNVGSLALKYDLALTVLNETVVNNHKLSEVIKVGVINGALDANTTRDGLIAAVSSWTPLEKFKMNTSGVTLEVGGEDTVTLVLYWQPNSNDIDNLYNMNNGRTEVLQLEIGVNLYATQVEAESDSFGIDYDEGAYIEDDAALKDALTQNKETIVVNLTSDVTWDVAAWENNPMGGELTKTIAINGNGHTITFNKTNSDWTNIVTGDAVLIIENATITDSGYDATSGTWNGHDITFADEVVLNNVVSLSALALMDNANLKNVTLTDDSTSDAYGLWIRPNGQTVNIDGLKMDMTTSDGNDRGIKIDNEYAESTDNGVTLNVKNSSFKTEKKGAILVKSTGNVTINLENVDISGVAADPINHVWIDEDNKAYADKTTVTGGKKVIEGESAPEVVADGLYKDGDTYYIANANGMKYLSAKALTGNNGTAETATLSLLNDIDMAGADFSAMIAQRGDTLNFLGNGHTISNVKVVSGENDNTTGQASMFYAYPNSTLNVSELILEDITVTAEANGTGYAAAVIGYGEGAIVLDDVDVVNATVVGVKSSGMLVGHLSGSLTATDCDISGTVTLADFAEEAAGHYAGKYIGTMAGAVSLNNCTANVTVSGNLNAANIGDVYGRKVSGSLKVDGAAPVADGASLTDAINNGDKVVLTNDVTYSTKITNNAEIDLAGNTFEATGTIELGNNADLTMTGGDYEVNGTYGHIDVRPNSTDGSVLLFENVDFSFNKLNKTNGPSTNRLGTVVEVCATATNAKTVIVFRGCTFDNAQVLFEGLSGTVGEFDATFENCTFNALTSSAPIYVQNYVKGTIKVTGCTFNLTCTSSTASAISVSSSNSTAVTVIAENNTINAVAATPYTYDPALGETEVHNVKVNGTPANIKFISISGTTSTATETGTIKTGIAV